MSCEEQLAQCADYMGQSAGIMKAVAADCENKFQAATDTTAAIMQSLGSQVEVQQEMINRAALTSVLLIFLCIGFVVYILVAYFKIRREYRQYITNLHDKLNIVLAKQPEAASGNIRYWSEDSIPKFKWFGSMRWIAGLGLFATILFGFIV